MNKKGQYELVKDCENSSKCLNLQGWKCHWPFKSCVANSEMSQEVRMSIVDCESIYCMCCGKFGLCVRCHSGLSVCEAEAAGSSH